ncbi:MAG: hypothetical protein ABWY93_00875 [Mycobacterium sp.]
MSGNSKSDDDTDARKSPPPAGPVDHGGKGGMATRELAPEISEPDQQEPPD